MRNKGNFIKGSVEMLILHILKNGDCYGYELTQLISKHSRGVLKLPEGTLYPALYKLEDKGFISEEKKTVGKRQTRVYYHMEPEGREYLQQLLEEYHQAHEAIQAILNKEIQKEGE